MLQIVGGIAGALLEAALVPGLTWAWFGHHNKEHAPGCFYPGAVNSWELFLWELVLTFVLVRARSPGCLPSAEVMVGILMSFCSSNQSHVVLGYSRVVTYCVHCCLCTLR